MDKALLKEYAARVRELIDVASPSSRDAAYFRCNDFLQRALEDATLGTIDKPRNDAGLKRWMVEVSERDDVDLTEAVACFLILLRGWDLSSF